MTAASDALADRLRPALGEARLAPAEKKMFGGTGFILDGHLLIGTTAKGDLLVRVDPTKMDEALARPGAYAMHMGARVMTGFIAVRADLLPDDRSIKKWIEYAQRYVRTLPAK